ncbi:hypothetical protein OGAPHI_006466 [Ogataea philodendri]|uniref:Metallo-beta-lactamase domain-containing protein n=1 Tax=Ogataea philodendri TaxID=1378263 RepID=A0A9P8NYM7_9ASCO|nr:uncharacterized protein OGAPHI_006466 [Ogataea philodendri]KAH3661617.1 hypothetical protein OGAPHI_006466 [Ogataea philodendri]
MAKRKPVDQQVSILKFCRTGSDIVKKEVTVIDLVSDKEEDSLFVKDEDEELPNQIEPDQIEQLPCPICSVDMSYLSLDDRTMHVDACLVEPNTKPVLYKPMKIGGQESKRKVSAKRPKPPIPDHKIMEFGNYMVAVDAFCYAIHPGISTYLLTHFHSDHYGGLTKNWDNGKTIIVTPITYNLLVFKFKIDPSLLLPVDYNQTITVPHTQIKVTCLDANHCPGSGIFVLESPGCKYLHCGDCRINRQMLESLLEIGHFNKIYLDTTYLDPLYNFPKQEYVIDQLCQLLKSKMETFKFSQQRVIDYFTKGKPQRFLVVIGTYLIGKERLAIGLAKALGSKIYCQKEKKDVLNQFGWPDLDELLETEHPENCQVHLVALPKLNKDFLMEYLKTYSKHFKAAIGVRPTGWSLRYGKPVPSLDDIVESETPEAVLEAISKHFDRFRDDNPCRILRIPYSEHSSYRELFYFTNLLSYDELIPTVDVHNEEEQHAVLTQFRNYKKLCITNF